MTTWTSDELRRVDAAEELQITTLRGDGTARNPVIVWVFRHGDDLYVRAVTGRTSAWFRGTQARREGRIRAGGVERGVVFAEVAPSEIDDAIDAAYRDKYRRYPAPVEHITSPTARAATIRLVPR